MNFKTIKENGVPVPRFNEPFISCIVYSHHLDIKDGIGGIIETCRWDVRNKEWLKSDIKSNLFLRSPYMISHYDDSNYNPYKQ